MNTLNLVGNLGRNPELVTSDNGTRYTDLLVITNDRRSEENNSDHIFVRVFDSQLNETGGMASACVKYTAKGSRVGILGTLRNRSFVDAAGNTVWRMNVIASSVEFLSPAQKGTVAPTPTKELTPAQKGAVTKAANKAATEKATAEEYSDDDIPFGA